jgi:hypothetical protein
MMNFSKCMKMVASGVVLAGLSVTPMMAQSGEKPSTGEKPSITGPTNAAASHSWTTDQLVTSTIHEAWVMSGRNEDQFFEMVQALAVMSAQKRGLTLPDNQAAGEKAGAWIKKEAKRDSDQLLYAVVDQAVIKTGVRNAVASK